MKEEMRDLSIVEEFEKRVRKERMKTIALGAACIILVFCVKNKVIQIVIASAVALVLFMLGCKLIKKVWLEKANGQLTKERLKEYWRSFLFHWLLIFLLSVTTMIEIPKVAEAIYMWFMILAFVIINNARHVRINNEFSGIFDEIMNSITSDKAE